MHRKWVKTYRMRIVLQVNGSSEGISDIAGSSGSKLFSIPSRWSRAWRQYGSMCRASQDSSMSFGCLSHAAWKSHRISSIRYRKHLATEASSQGPPMDFVRLPRCRLSKKKKKSSYGIHQQFGHIICKLELIIRDPLSSKVLKFQHLP